MAEYVDRENIIPYAIDDDYEEGGERLIVEYRDIQEMSTADVIERENVKNLIEAAIEDGWELDYALERLKEI